MKLTYLIIIALLLGSCESILNSGDYLVITNKSIPQSREEKFYYTIERPVVNINFYSDSDWNVRDTIKFTK